MELFRGHGLEPRVYVDEADVEVVLRSVPSTCSAHVEYLGSIARTGDLDATVGAPAYAAKPAIDRDRSDG
jgi:hypothetical protein